jgi:putative peptide zinc metalloprotease protein
MFRPWAVGLAVVFVAAAWTLLAVQFDDFVSRLPEFQQFFGWPNLVYLWLTLSMCKIIHEYGHGLSCKHFGGECHEMGVMLLVFSPCLYCDVTDSWMLKNKWKRIAIAAAGMYIEVVLSAIAVFVWWYTTPGLLHHLALNVFFITTITTVIFNADPLLRFDGYYMMSDWLEIPNLRIKADKYLRDKFAWYCLGIESRPDPFLPESGRVWFAVYTIAAALYRWLILFGITLFLYTVLKPYGLQSIGATMAVLSLAGIVGTLGFNVYRIITAPRNEPMSRPKILMSLAALGCFAAVALTIPIPWFIQSALLVQPEQVQHVYVVTPGRLEEMPVRPGTQVTKGQKLAQLINEAKEDQHRSLKVQKDVQEKAISRYRFLGDVAQEQLARKRLAALDEELKEVEKQLQQLTIVAPCDGTVVEPPRKAEPKVRPGQQQLKTWDGTPLDAENLGSFLEAGTHMLSVAPSERLEAILLVDQSNRNDVFVGQKIRMKFDHIPDRTYEGQVDEISERQLDFAPEALSNKLGGDLATVTDEQGRERLTSSVYQATVLLDKDSELFKAGMRGKARFIIAERTAWDWLWRAFRQTFHFRL